MSWTSSDGWALTNTGPNRTAYPLDLDPYAAPATVAARTRARLAGTPDPNAGTAARDLREAFAAEIGDWMDQREKI